MSPNPLMIVYNQFYYAGLPESGQQVTCASVQNPQMLTAVRDLCCGIAFTGCENEERLLYSTALDAYCKVYLRQDGRNYFYHLLTPEARRDTAAGSDATERETTAFVAALAARDPAAVTHSVAPLPHRRGEINATGTDALLRVIKSDEAALAALLYCVYRPFFTPGVTARLSLQRTSPLPPTGFEADGDMCNAAALLLALLPNTLRKSARLRFSADQATYQKPYDCTHALFYNDDGADFSFAAPRVPGIREDPCGIYAAMAAYICKNGIRTYRTRLCALLEGCLADSRLTGGPLLPLLCAVLQAAGLPLQEKSSIYELEYYLTHADEAWFTRYAEVLTAKMNDADTCLRVRELLLQNRCSLAERQTATIRNKASDGFLRVLARTYRFADNSEKESCMAAFFSLLSSSQDGMTLLMHMKAEMAFTHVLPAENTPDALFAGTRLLEMTNPPYVKAAMEKALDSFMATREAEWLYAALPLLRYETAAGVIRLLFTEAFDTLLEASEDEELLLWLTEVCAPGLPDERRPAVLQALQQKKLPYEMLLDAAKTLGLPADSVPKPPKLSRVPDEVQSLQALADFCRSGAGKKTAAFHNSVVERMLALLEKDCDGKEIQEYIPEILKSISYNSSTRQHTALETALCRQLTVMLPGAGETETAAWVAFMTSLRTQYSLSLFCDTPTARLHLKEGGRDKKGIFLQRYMPLLPLLAMVALAGTLLFVLPAKLPLLQPLATTMLPALFAILAGVLLLLHAILRKGATARYLLPGAAAMLLLALLRLLA